MIGAPALVRLVYSTVIARWNISRAASGQPAGLVLSMSDGLTATLERYSATLERSRPFPGRAKACFPSRSWCRATPATTSAIPRRSCRVGT
jgi:hypothetical protein